MVKIKKYDIPMTRDPFVNTPLLPAGIDTKTGEERFFISTWNANVGCLSALVTPSGEERIYRFKKGEGICGCGAYSSVLSDHDTMWLCSDLSYVVKLKLSTGEYHYYPTGARSGLVFCGMQYDKVTGKLLFMANAYPCLCAVSFDTKLLKTVHIYDNFTKATLGQGGFRNNDGTYTVRLTTEGSALYRWNPLSESLNAICDINEAAQCSRVIFDDMHRAYIPFEGWMTSDGAFIKNNKPKEEIGLWFGKTETKAYGAKEDSDGIEIYSWDLGSGEVNPVCHIPDGTLHGVALTTKGEILSVSVFGELSKYSQDGTLLLKKLLKSDAQGHVDCLMSVDTDYVMGTPFISQRFWMLDLKSGKGFDAGRAATKCGEVLRVWNKAEKVYMASYTEGMLTEYDPKKELCFPANPRIVAQAPEGMRPVADAEDGENLYYASNHHYGIIGCVMTRYNTKTAEAVYLDNPLDYQHIISLVYDKKNDCLFGTSTFRTDCDVTEVQSDTCYIIIMDKNTLEVKEKIALESGTNYASIIGAVDETTYLFSQTDAENQTSIQLYNTEEKTVTSLHTTFQECHISQLKYLKENNQFVGLTDTDISLWQVNEGSFIKTESVLEESEVYSVFGEKNRILAATPQHVYVLDSL